MCRLYSAFITKEWTPASNAELNPNKLEGSSCFTLWDHDQDILPGSSFTSSTPYKSQSSRQPKNLVDGYYCREFADYIFGSLENDAWLQVDLKTSRTVQKIMVQMWKSQYGSFFTDVEIRVGDTPGSGDFSANSLFDSYSGTAPNGGSAVFEPSTSRVGRYISFKSKKLYIAQLTVLGF